MRFLAPFLGFLAGEAAMVIHPARRIKMGEWTFYGRSGRASA
jgi:hypothetical protein